MALMYWLARAMTEWVLLWAAHATLDALRAYLVRRRLRSVHWLDDACVLTPNSLVATATEISEEVGHLRWALERMGVNAIWVAESAAARRALHSAHDSECSALYWLRMMLCTTLWIWQLVGDGKLLRCALLVSLWYALGFMSVCLAASGHVWACHLDNPRLHIVPMDAAFAERFAAPFGLNATHALIYVRRRPLPAARAANPTAVAAARASPLPVRRSPATPQHSTGAAPLRSTSAAPVRSTSAAPLRSTSAAPVRSTSAAPRRSTSAAPADDRTCVACLASKRTHIGRGCGHLCLCATCAELIGRRCPICSAVGTFIQVYDP